MFEMLEAMNITKKDFYNAIYNDSLYKAGLVTESDVVSATKDRLNEILENINKINWE